MGFASFVVPGPEEEAEKCVRVTARVRLRRTRFESVDPVADTLTIRLIGFRKRKKGNLEDTLWLGLVLGPPD